MKQLTFVKAIFRHLKKVFSENSKKILVSSSQTSSLNKSVNKKNELI